MRNFIPGIASTIAAEEMTYFFLLELQLGATVRYNDSDIQIINEGETFTPIAFKFGDISGSATLAVESIDIEIDDTGKTLAAIVLNEDIRNKWAILSVGAIDSEYVVHVQEFLRGIIGGW